MAESNRHPIRCIAVVVAGGQGIRMGAQIRKQFLMLGERPVLVWTLDAFDRHPDMEAIIVVVPESDMDFCTDQVTGPRKFSCPVHLVSGGNARQDSVGNGVRRALTLADDPGQTLVFIHDGVRPFVPAPLLDRLRETAARTGACIPVLPVTDTLKQVDDQDRIVATVDRSRLFRAQTPQVFRLDRIAAALNHAQATGFTGTDDASVMAHAGFQITTIPGDPVNIKLTTPHDLDLARYLILTQTV
jgi:2-C-methyl-D-erythritol 4-phosphate cytidylyltransferase